MCVGVDECIIIELCINPHQSFISIECPKDSFLSLLKAGFFCSSYFRCRIPCDKKQNSMQGSFYPNLYYRDIHSYDLSYFI